MGFDPDLGSLRRAVGGGENETIDKVAAGSGVLLMGATILWLVYELNRSAYAAANLNILVAFGLPVAAFIAGSIAAYMLFYGARLVLFLTRHFWWAILLALIALGYLDQH